VNHIQGVVAVPPVFGRVKNAIFEAAAVRFVDTNGAEVRALIDHEFLQDREKPRLL